MYAAAEADHEGFWAEQGRKYVTWAKDFDTTLDWSQAPFAKWFVGGELNVAYNCVDRHVEAGNGDRVAIHFEGDQGDTRTITYADLQREVNKVANALTELGVGKGDTVMIYMPMIPETVFTMLACARLGAIHSLVFGGFSAEALHTRINDAQAKIAVTTDGQWRRGKPAPLKAAVDEALEHADNTVEKVLVVKRTGTDVTWTDGRDIWWDDVVPGQSDEHTPEAFDSEHPLFILYTSGTTGKPKGIFHTSGGYLTQAAYTNAIVHDVHPETDVYWCTADVGWVTGHSYIVYGPLANGATQVLYEGTPDTPHQGRWWEIIEKYKVSIFYTAPTAIRTFMKWGHDIPDKFDLSSIRVLGSVGEPINPEAWLWYRKYIGSDKAPIVDTWWQTETGAIMISPLPGVTTLEPGSAQKPIPGISAEILDDEGNPFTEAEKVGYLVLTKPWPSMLRGIWGDPDRYRDTYWSRFDGRYFAGGPAVVVDLDGVISDAAHRQHHLSGASQDWEGFFGACADDEPIEAGRRLVGSLAAELTVVICTARPDWVHDRTVVWLDRHQVRRDLLLMRPSEQREPSWQYKRRALQQLRNAGFDVRMAFDDDQRNVDMFVAEGVPTMYIHSGYYET
ncbi:MAG: acetate--CoA ligase [Phycicoccus sp.]|nr:acetate--CoA ligase [Phycicoccus sp.]